MQLAQCFIALAQLNTVVGDIEGNARKIIEAAVQASKAGAVLLLTPELSLCGYPVQDWVLRKDVIDACAIWLERLAKELAAAVPDMAVVVGYPEAYIPGNENMCAPINCRKPQAYNSAAVLFQGQVIARHRKQALPDYSVFDESRVFSPGSAATVFEFHGHRFGLLICEDIWVDAAIKACMEEQPDILLVINASPWHRGKKAERLGVLRAVAQKFGRAIAYCNQVGAQDELIFDGSSCVVDTKGEVKLQLPSFSAALAVAEFQGYCPIRSHNPLAFENILDHPEIILNDLYQALCLGVHDYVKKNGFRKVLVGLSGGVDSALTLAIAVDALGKASVRAVMMPSPYTAAMSLEDAKSMAEGLGVRYDNLPIEGVMQAATTVLEPFFEGKEPDLTEENLQARTRGLLLMALSNKHGELLLTTGNKSEMAVGYATLYGDMCGGLAVLKDVTKHWVYALSHYRNRLGRVIPERILTRAPSAELRPNQTDQDSLPPYDQLDAVIEGYVEEGVGADVLVERGFDRAMVERIIHLIRISEYKRQQSAIGLKVTARAFGKDWRFPVTSKRFDQ